MKTTNILIVGVGGQGSLLASRILGNIFLQHGLDVKVSEVHGMSQRGGSVVTYVKSGDKVCSPLIELGTADVIIAFEQMEAMRYLPYLKIGGTIALSTQKIMPMPVITGAAQYPEDIIEQFNDANVNVVDLDAWALAEQAGNVKSANIVMLGALSRLLHYEQADWYNSIRANVKQKFVEMNIVAFELGRNSL